MFSINWSINIPYNGIYSKIYLDVSLNLHDSYQLNRPVKLSKSTPMLTQIYPLMSLFNVFISNFHRVLVCWWCWNPFFFAHYKFIIANFISRIDEYSFWGKHRICSWHYKDKQKLHSHNILNLKYAAFKSRFLVMANSLGVQQTSLEFCSVLKVYQNPEQWAHSGAGGGGGGGQAPPPFFLVEGGGGACQLIGQSWPWW